MGRKTDRLRAGPGQQLGVGCREVGDAFEGVESFAPIAEVVTAQAFVGEHIEHAAAL
jgi:hypothetical protein